MNNGYYLRGRRGSYNQGRGNNNYHRGNNHQQSYYNNQQSHYNNHLRSYNNSQFNSFVSIGDPSRTPMPNNRSNNGSIHRESNNENHDQILHFGYDDSALEIFLDTGHFKQEELNCQSSSECITIIGAHHLKPAFMGKASCCFVRQIELPLAIDINSLEVIMIRNGLVKITARYLDARGSANSMEIPGVETD